MKTLALIVLAAAVAAATAGALAQDRVTAKLRGTLPALEPDRPWRVEFTLRRGGRPLVGARASFWVGSSAARRSFRAHGLGGGRYRATVVLAAPGRHRYGVSIPAVSIFLGVLRVEGVPLRAPLGLAVGPDSALYVADSQGTTVVRIDPTTRARSVVAGGFDHPENLAFDPDGLLAVSDASSRIFRVERSGARTLLAGTGTRGHTGDGGAATGAALGGPSGMDFDVSGDLVIAEYDGWIRVVRRNGTIGSLAGTGGEGYSGDDGPAARAVLRHPHDVAALDGGAISVADSHNGAIRRIGPDGIIRTLAAGLPAVVAITPAPGGGVFAAAEGGIYRVAADGRRSLVTSAALAITIASDAAGNVYFSQLDPHRVRRVDAATGKVTTIVP